MVIKQVSILNVYSKEQRPEQLEREKRRKRRRRRSPDHAKPKKHRTLLVSAIDEQAKVIHVSLLSSNTFKGTLLRYFHKPTRSIIGVRNIACTVATKARVY